MSETKKSDVRFVYVNDSGILCIVEPAEKSTLTLEEIKAKACPSDRPVYTVNKSEVPTDRSFRNAWTYTE